MLFRKKLREIEGRSACCHSVQKLLSSSLLSRSTIVSVGLYGCETWSLTLREEGKLRAFENMVLRRIFGPKRDEGRSQWPRSLRRRSTADRLLTLWVRIPPGEWMSVCCKCCVLSGRGLCDALITWPEKSYRLWCVVVCDLETSRLRRP